MNAWITKDSNGLVQLWNECPNYDRVAGIWFGMWDDDKNAHEIGIDVTNNKFLNNLVGINDKKLIEQIED